MLLCHQDCRKNRVPKKKKLPKELDYKKIHLKKKDYKIKEHKKKTQKKKIQTIKKPT